MHDRRPPRKRRTRPVPVPEIGTGTVPVCFWAVPVADPGIVPNIKIHHAYSNGYVVNTREFLVLGQGFLRNGIA